MPLRKNKKKTIAQKNYFIFSPLLSLVLLLWILYRSLFTFPVYFDEIIGKAIFFGVPVWLFILISNLKKISQTFALSKLKRGLILGLAVGGIYGFVTVIIGLAGSNQKIQPAYYFMADQFWWEFLLALFTAFWETLFFYSFVYITIQAIYSHWSLFKQVLMVALIFLVFHLPNIFLRFSGLNILSQIFLLFLFAIGQGLLFENEKNAYALVLSHAIWGMVLLIHLG